MEKIAFEVTVQNFNVDGFWCPHQECEWASKRFDTFSGAICHALPLVEHNDDVTISIVTFKGEKPGHTTTVALYDFLYGKMSHRAKQYDQL